jgi:hypothetical protein
LKTLYIRSLTRLNVRLSVAGIVQVVWKNFVVRLFDHFRNEFKRGFGFMHTKVQVVSSADVALLNRVSDSHFLHVLINY